MIAYKCSVGKMWLGEIKFFLHLELNLSCRAFKYYNESSKYSREVNILENVKIGDLKNFTNENNIMVFSTQNLPHFAVLILTAAYLSVWTLKLYTGCTKGKILHVTMHVL